MRHYYDLYRLLRRRGVREFIRTDEDNGRNKKGGFRTGDNPDITQNLAFILADPKTRPGYRKASNESAILYFGDKSSF